MSVNKVTLLGNTGKAPDFKEFDNGGCVATITLATTKRGFTTKDGRQIPERTEWHNIVLQNGLAKVANQYVKKGDKLYIEGELRTRSYDDAQGVKRYITEIVATDMEMLTPKTTGAGTQAPPTALQPYLKQVNKRVRQSNYRKRPVKHSHGDWFNACKGTEPVAFRPCQCVYTHPVWACFWL
jgi:single-strand DNA-binding protein